MAKKKTPGPAEPSSSNRAVLSAIKSSALDIEKKILARKKPTMKFPVRSLSNVRYHPDKGYFEMAGQKKERTLTVNTVKTFAQTLRMIALSKDLVENDDIATKREAYYVSKNWEDARFSEQPESDTVMDDVEAYFSVNREQLGFIPEEKGETWRGAWSCSTGTAIPAECCALTAPNSAQEPTAFPSRSSTCSSKLVPISSWSSKRPACFSGWSSTTTGRRPTAY